MLELRQIDLSDVDSLLTMKEAVHALHVAHRPDIFRPMSRHAIAAWLRERVTSETTLAWLAEDDGLPVGYILAARQARDETRFSLARRWCEIDEIAVATSSQRRGVARALVDRVVAQAHESGLGPVELLTWSFNEGARTAFARMGFTPTVTRYQRTAS